MDLNLLVLFDVVMKEQHVGQAATALHLSPSAVSHGLARLRRLFDDPLFLRTPKGVVATDRAAQLAEPIAEVLARVSSEVASATPFDAARSTRRFTLGMADATAAVAKRGLARRVALVVPSFMLALASVAETHLLTALPESLARAHAPRLGVAFVRSPLKLPRSTIRAIVPESALLDAGVAWLLDAAQHVTREAAPAKLRSRSPRARTSPRASRGGA